MGQSSVSLRAAFVKLVALHDIGKLSEKFCNDIGLPVPTDCSGNVPSSSRHWQISFSLLTEELDDDVRELIGVTKPRARKALYAAVAGHHGEPPDVDPYFNDRVGVPACKQFIQDLSGLGDLDSIPFDVSGKSARLLTWSLAGLTVVADWIGSDQTRFPYHSPSVSVADYWTGAKARALNAVADAGIRDAKRSSFGGVSAMYGIERPRPMQDLVTKVHIPEEPTLHILEDVTGSGKTEAAMALAHRLMENKAGEGVYVALPTMATANAMYERLGKVYRSFFGAGSQPSIVLAHGKRLLNDSFLESLLVDSTDPESKATDVEVASARATCSAWIADDRRKTFLAEVGVGTIDQAFLAVLPVKHSTIRLFGLARRILVIDEAHACDPYMQKALERLLTMQGAMRGSAIVMTATLTQDSRQRLVDAYREGLGMPNAPALEESYPSLTVVASDDEQCKRIPVPVDPELRRCVPVKRLSEFSAAVELLVEQSSAGACCVWIRNTVDSAIEATTLLRERGVEVDLFHARFAIHDRLVVEDRIVACFGKLGTNTQRRGRVLVATQVVEQSLDLDFDVMVSDVAPIDALVQRVGRLWRHTPAQVARDRCGVDLVLYVVSPDPEACDETSWTSGDVAGSAAVYGAPVLWRTALALAETKEIDSPGNLRQLLERVSGNNMPPVPDFLEKLEMRLEGEMQAESALARGNLVTVGAGYFSAKGMTDNESYPTRAATPSIRIVLARRVDNGLAFWAADDVTGESSEVSISQFRYARLKPEIDGAAGVNGLCKAWPKWKQLACPVAIVEQNGRIGAIGHYNDTVGLTFDN